MAITKLKHNTSRVSRAQRGDVSRMTESFTVETDSDMTPTQVLNTVPAGVYALLPKIRTRHPTTPAYVCVDVGIEPLTVRSWRLTAEYTAKHDSGSHARMSRRGGVREIPIWRFASITVPGDYPWPPVALTGGTALDVNGQPEISRGWVHDITVDVSLDVAYVKATYGSADYWQQQWTAALLRRNSAVWNGYDIGLVVFAGWSEQMTEDPWMTCSLQFRADQYFHLEQRVLPHTDGQTLLTSSSTIAGTPVRHADNVYWYQPYRGTRVDLTTLWPVGELVTPTPEWI